MSIQAGKLRHRVQIQQNNPTRNSFNETKDIWQTVKTHYAEIRPLSGLELWQAQQVQAQVTHKIRMRYTAGLRPTMRLLFRGRALNILSIINVEERNRELEIMAKEQT